jgi:TorA maturation chaperone TorD
MRDHGLEEAIRAAGSVSELARQLGISQPSVSNWTRVPAERVVAVESLTSIPRHVLRPDLYGTQDPVAEIDEIEAARAREYSLLAALLTRTPNAELMSRLSGLRGDVTPLGVAHVDLAEAASRADIAQVEREFFNLFIGVGRSELLPYASYYLTGFLHERPLARLREDLAAIGVERREGQAEPEDHAGILCEIMAGLIDGRLTAPAGTDQRIFEKHLAPWIGRFFADLERCNTADFYRRVGTLGRVFIEIETEAFSLAA